MDTGVSQSSEHVPNRHLHSIEAAVAPPSKPITARHSEVALNRAPGDPVHHLSTERGMAHKGLFYNCLDHQIKPHNKTAEDCRRLQKCIIANLLIGFALTRFFKVRLAEVKGLIQVYCSLYIAMY